MPAPANLIREESTTTGTGNLTLAAVNGYVRFSDSTYGFGTGGTDDFWYFISNRNAAEWEIGTGHMSDANTLVRDTVLFSSNSNAAVSFSAGTKDISNDIPASYQVFVEGTPAQGDIIFRNASAWTRLAAGSVGQALWTGGAGANPAWAGGIRLLNSGTVSSAATLDIVLTSYTGYRGFRVVLSGFLPATDNATLWQRFSTNGGSSFDAGASDYKSIGTNGYTNGIGVGHFGSNGAAQIACTHAGVGNLSREGLNGTFDFFNLTSAAFWSRVQWQVVYSGVNDEFFYAIGAGGRTATQDTDAIRFLFSSGNIAEGNWALYGYS
jgi:hypothetical protein